MGILSSIGSLVSKGASKLLGPVSNIVGLIPSVGVKASEIGVASERTSIFEGIKNFAGSLFGSSKNVGSKVGDALIGGATLAGAAKLIGGSNVDAGAVLKEGTAFRLNPVGAVIGTASNLIHEHPLATGITAGAVAGVIGAGLNPNPQPSNTGSNIPITPLPTSGGESVIQNYYIQPQMPTGSITNAPTIPSSPLNPSPEPVQPSLNASIQKTTHKKKKAKKRGKKKHKKSIKRRKHK